MSLGTPRGPRKRLINVLGVNGDNADAESRSKRLRPSGDPWGFGGSLAPTLCGFRIGGETQMYLVRVRRGGKAHHWDGKDTKCRMASSGGLSPRKYEVSEETGGRLICHMCTNVVAREAADELEARFG